MSKQEKNHLDEIEQAIELSGLENFTGRYKELGGGEINDTFVLECGDSKAVLRIAKYSDVNNLGQEARALKLLKTISGNIPRLIYFNEDQRISNREWILETHVSGVQANKLTLKHFRELGRLLAKVHKTRSEASLKLDFWENLLDAAKHFGDERMLLNHPDSKVRKLIRKAHKYFDLLPAYKIIPSLVHGDATLNNILVDGDKVSLIDWELSSFKDPMSDFSTLYYEDMEYNKGRWRIHIKHEEKTSLLSGYTESGGVIDKERISIWMNLDKLGAAIYLYWKVNQSGHKVSAEAITQYKVDLNNITNSLDRTLLP